MQLSARQSESTRNEMKGIAILNEFSKGHKDKSIHTI